MIAKTEAIVLRVIPLRTSSQVSIWLTREGCRVAVVAKGVTAPRSRLQGQYDLGYTCELLYYRRERAGLHQIRECAPLRTRSYLRSDWAAMACASYACHLMNLTVPEGAELPMAYPLLEAFLDSLSTGPGVEAVYRFELNLLHLLGYAPRLHTCGQCGTRCAGGPADAPVVFSSDSGGLLCARCAGRSGGDGGVHRQPVMPTVLAFLRAPETYGGAGLSLMEEFQAARLLGHFLGWHMDLAPECRTVALRLLRYRASMLVNTPVPAIVAKPQCSVASSSRIV